MPVLEKPNRNHKLPHIEVYYVRFCHSWLWRKHHLHFFYLSPPLFTITEKMMYCMGLRDNFLVSPRTCRRVQELMNMAKKWMLANAYSLGPRVLKLWFIIKFIWLYRRRPKCGRNTWKLQGKFIIREGL